MKTLNTENQSEIIGSTASNVNIGVENIGNFPVIIYKEHIFIAFYNETGYLEVKAKPNEDEAWVSKILPIKTGHDSHNYITMAVDYDGFIHLCGNMHCEPIIYYKSLTPLDITSLNKSPNLTTEETESSATYPLFFNREDELYFTYRTGRSGNGSQYYLKYNKNKLWKYCYSSPVIDGQGLRNPYPQKPALSSDGYFHISWVWRDSIDAETTHTLCYAKTRDFKAWLTSLDEIITLPIVLGNSEIVDSVPLAGGIINNNNIIGFDSKGHTLISYHKYDDSGSTQIYIARKKGCDWSTTQVTQWDSRWEFRGSGTLSYELKIFSIQAAKNNELALNIFHKTFGYQTYYINEDSLQVIGIAQGNTELPSKITLKEHSTNEVINWSQGISFLGKKKHKHFIHWNTTPPSRDQPPVENRLPSKILYTKTLWGVEPDNQRLNPPKTLTPALPPDLLHLQFKIETERNIKNKFSISSERLLKIVSSLESQVETNQLLIENTTQKLEQLTLEKIGIEKESLQTRQALDNALVKHKDTETQLIKSLQVKSKEIIDIRNSTSWKVTKPIRNASRTMSKLKLVIERAKFSLKLIKTGNQSHLVELLIPYYQRHIPLSVKKIIPNFIKDKYKSSQPPHKHKAPHLSANSSKAISNTIYLPKPLPLKPSIGIIVWDVSHNPLGRAYLLAEALLPSYNVVIFGPSHTRFGGGIWEPLQSSSLPVIALPDSNDPTFLTTCKKIAKNSTFSAVIACKPRLPSLILGYEIKLAKNIPLILDIDDHELAFTRYSTPPQRGEILDTLSTEGLRPDSDFWSAYSENLLDGADEIIVSNTALQDKFGGTIVPHGRDELVFSPGKFDKNLLRTDLGYSEKDFVILFAGTPRKHKGITSLVESINSLNNKHIKLLIIGQPDNETSQYINTNGSSFTQILGNQPFELLPSFLACANLVCLLQDIESDIAKFQLPAKLSDALAFGIPVLASPTPPLQRYIKDGFVTSTSQSTLSKDINAAYINQHKVDHNAIRTYFLKNLSYAEINRSLAGIIERNLHSTPSKIKDGSEYIRFRTLTKTNPVELSASDTTEQLSNRDIVLIWKQNDLTLYGRRPDMLITHLSKRKDVRKIFVLEPPLSFHDLGTWSAMPINHQGRSLYKQWMKKTWGLLDSEKVFYHAFTFKAKKLSANTPEKWPTINEYISSVEKFLSDRNFNDRNSVSISYPKNDFINQILRSIKPQVSIIDIVDDHRAWPNLSLDVINNLDRHYREVLANCDLAITNCEPVKKSMISFNETISVIPNGIDLAPPSAFEPKTKQFDYLKSLRGPIIGFVGNLEAKIDVDLLNHISNFNPNWNIVLVGSTHASSNELLQLRECKNIYFPGVVQYSEVKHWISKFDVAIIPHKRMKMTEHMNPLKLYLFLGMDKPIVSTPIENLGADLKKHIRVEESYSEFVNAIQQLLLSSPPKSEALRRDILNNTWESRTNTLFELINNHVSSPAKLLIANSTKQHEDSYTGDCIICGYVGSFYKNHRSFREGYHCPVCKSSLRYRGQAEAIIETYSPDTNFNLKELANAPDFSSLSIYEPGVTGPFRTLFTNFENYRNSFYWDDVPFGDKRKGVECQSLESLTFDDNQFDLIISSDIMEHVRNPSVAFAEIFRVLKPNGCHIFSIPVELPMEPKTVYRVDTSTDQDIHILEPHYHGNGAGGRSLVYSDFGADLVDLLKDQDYEVTLTTPLANHHDVQRLVTFITRKTRD